MAWTTVKRLASLFLSALAVMACGGTGGSGEIVGVDGVAQKGPLMQGSTVLVSLLNNKTWQPSGATYTFEIVNNLGNFSAASTVFTSQYADSTAIGYYQNELSGAASADIITVRGLSDLVADKAINLNVLTTLIRARMRALMTRATNKLTFAAARTQAQKELLAAFYVYNSATLFPGGATQPASFNEADLSKARSADQVLAAVSALLMAIGQNGSGTTLWLSRFETDLADDGLINNSPGYSPTTTSVLQTAQRSADLRAVAANLNRFYGGNGFASDSVSQWNDSSGGDDQVIDRYKFTATNIESGATAVSSPYTAGSDDTGQCLFVSAGALNRNGIPVSGTAKSVAGDAYTVTLAAPAVGSAPAVSYLQRAAPPASGICPTAAPTTGITRLAKFSVSPKSLSVIAMAAGPNHALAIRSDGTLWAWGLNDNGQLGDGTTTSSAIPKQIGSGFVAVAAGYAHSLGLKSDGTLWAWGGNWSGQLGDGTTSNRLTPTQVGTGYMFVTGGRYANTFAIKTDGTLWGWGTNELYSFPDASGQGSLLPKLIDSGVATVGESSHHGAYIKIDGTMWVWGLNWYGINGTGNTVDASSAVIGPTGFAGATISRGWDFNLSLKPDGTLWGWGYNGEAALGDGTLQNRLSPIILGSSYRSASAGIHHSVAIKTDGTLWYWGMDYTGQKSLVPASIGAGFNGVIAAGDGFSLAAKDDGTVWSWGANTFGQLGDGTMSSGLQLRRVVFP